MKKLGICLFLIVLLVALAKAQDVKYLDNGRITGMATTQPVSLSIFVTNASPSLTILNPVNSIYITNSSIRLYYTQYGAESVWFNLDGGENTTLIDNVYLFDAQEGEHTVNLYANNSDGLTSFENITFTVNTSILSIIYDEFRNKGNTSDFVNYSLGELENLGNITFEIPSYGKIYFYGVINITDINSSEKNIIDFDYGINISQNRVFLNSSYLSNLDREAKISIRGLSYTNPRIIKDGSVCSVSICKIESYQNGELVFNVTGFSTYSAEETPSGSNNSNTGRSGGGGGGGGGVISSNNGSIIYSEIKSDVNKIYMKMKIGENKFGTFIIRNKGNTSEKILLKLDSDLAMLNESEFYLGPGEYKEIMIDFILRENVIPDLYVNKINAYNSNGEKILEIPLIIEAVSKKALFDVKVDISDKFKVINVGENVVVSVFIYNLGELKRVDSEVSYIVKDSDGNIVFEESETVAVETQASIVKEIKLPKKLKEGEYLLYVKTTYSGEVASASTSFSIIKSKNSNIASSIILIAIVIGIIIMLFMIIRKISEMRK